MTLKLIQEREEHLESVTNEKEDQSKHLMFL